MKRITRNDRRRLGTGSGRSSLALGAVVLGIILLGPLAAGAQGLSDIPGAFVDVGTGADAMGMGGAVVANTRGASSIFWNPAGLARSDRGREVALSYADVMGFVPYSAVSGAMRLGDTYTVGAGVLHSSDDVIGETTALVGVARRFATPSWAGDRRVDVGVTVKTRWASFGGDGTKDGEVTGSAFGFGLDAGAALAVTERATFGVTARDLASTLEWDSSVSGTYDESVPAALVLGLAVTPAEAVLVEVDLDKALHSDNRDLVMAGAQVELFKVASVRGGYRRALGTGDLEEFSLGAGARVEAGQTEITLDLAYLFGHLDDTLRFSVGLGL